MAIEIERKFLVSGDEWKGASATLCRQGYLSRAPERTVRIRIFGDNGWLTIKGPNQGALRAEFEYAIPLAEAESMLAMCEGPLIEKHRTFVPYAGLKWEVDEFLGANLGLVIAEVELESEHQEFLKPPWVGEEVTHLAQYYNSNLSHRPFRSWPDNGS